MSNVRIQLIYLCLVIFATCRVVAMFSGKTNRYSWSVEIFRLDEDFNFQQDTLLNSHRTSSTLNQIDVASIPVDNQSLQFGHQPLSHVATVTIKSQDGNSVLQSIVYSGVMPTARMMYSSPLGRKLDSGETILEVVGIANQLNYSHSGFTGLSILYPIPINDNTQSIAFFLNSVKIGNIVVESFREEFHNFGHLPNIENSPIKYVDDHVNGSNWLPELSPLSDIMVFPISDEDIIYTVDQFQSVSHQKILRTDAVPHKCPNSSLAIIPFRKYIVHLGKAGLNIFQVNLSGQWTATEDLSGLTQESICLLKAKASPRLYSTAMIAALSESRIFVSYLDKEPTAVHFKELIGITDESLCDYLSVPNDACKVIDIAFDPSSGCKLFILVFDSFNSTYILLKHSDISMNGGWSILNTFPSKLPNPSMNIDQILTNFQLNSSNPARTFTINGMSTLSRPDGVIYIWGDVLLVFDIHTLKLGWIPKFLPNGTADGDTAIQFNSASKKGLYSILTKNGAIWMGISHPFSRPYKWIISQFERPTWSAFISTFYDRQDKLFAIVLVTNESKSFIRKEEIIFEDESDANCLRTYNCQKLFLLCQDKDSSLHADLGSFSRTREFFLKPPILSEKVEWQKMDGVCNQIS